MRGRAGDRAAVGAASSPRFPSLQKRGPKAAEPCAPPRGAGRRPLRRPRVSRGAVPGSPGSPGAKAEKGRPARGRLCAPRGDGAAPAPGRSRRVSPCMEGAGHLLFRPPASWNPRRPRPSAPRPRLRPPRPPCRALSAGRGCGGCWFPRLSLPLGQTPGPENDSVGGDQRCRKRQQGDTGTDRVPRSDRLLLGSWTAVLSCRRSSPAPGRGTPRSAVRAGPPCLPLGGRASPTRRQWRCTCLEKGPCGVYFLQLKSSGCSVPAEPWSQQRCGQLLPSSPPGLPWTANNHGDRPLPSPEQGASSASSPAPQGLQPFPA
nr:sterile alpha motif domain-containing protein 1-like [Dasypus novemcinctus]